MYIGQNGDSYGFYWIYTGTNIGNEKSLDFYTQNGTSINDINVYSIKQDGIFNIKTSLNVDGNITG
jgi:hypothetical protein